MKITLWQQFSSNHSASFSVVGVFESKELAEATAKTIEAVVTEIGDYYRKRFPDYMDYYEWAENIDLRSLSPVEEKIRKAYKIRSGDWNSPPDWAYEGIVLRIHQNLLFVSSQGDIWSPFNPIDSIIKKAGGKFYGNQEGFGYASFSLVCEAKDTVSALELETTLRLIEEKQGFEYRYVSVPDGMKFEAEIEAKENKVIIKGIEIYASGRDDNYDTARKLEMLERYLKEQGCSGFEYMFRQGKQ